ncbi:BMP family ABC transporter substrate-binding protein [Streptomyces sp. ISL-43]|uniref:BMP family ABC transporter substrate-binding protein n=1 Tax=Streptomyces sp. ISL-43 TaxID=2819183 RepID=UPI001BE9C961|nr:BMP family ABC transporter substrate-binding protein [Streptomyces sp. ISL-43]MBT2452945.1 BMP family ABC transporter substrate-binding protein [Streptomyces sp. ISL-43]
MKTRRTWRNQADRPESGSRGAVLGRVLAGAAGALRGRAGWVAGGAAVLALCLVGGWLFTGGQDGPPDPRARQYKEFDACLLTDEKGIVTGAAAAPVWEGMQKASLETRARVTYVPVVGEPSAENARPLFNSLMQRKCDVVLAVGAAQVEVTEAGAKQYPRARFVVVDGAATAGNVMVAKSGDSLKETVAEAIRRAVDSSGV